MRFKVAPDATRLHADRGVPGALTVRASERPEWGCHISSMTKGHVRAAEARARARGLKQT